MERALFSPIFIRTRVTVYTVLHLYPCLWKSLCTLARILTIPKGLRSSYPKTFSWTLWHRIYFFVWWAPGLCSAHVFFYVASQNMSDLSNRQVGKGEGWRIEEGKRRVNYVFLLGPYFLIFPNCKEMGGYAGCYVSSNCTHPCCSRNYSVCNGLVYQ